MKNSIKKNCYDDRSQIYDYEYDIKTDHVFLYHFIECANDILEVPCGSGRNVELYIGKRTVFIDIEPDYLYSSFNTSMRRLFWAAVPTVMRRYLPVTSPGKYLTITAWSRKNLNALAPSLSGGAAKIKFA